LILNMTKMWMIKHLASPLVEESAESALSICCYLTLLALDVC
jgi:hypothetical protein